MGSTTNHFAGVESLRGKRLLICEEALINYKGHFYSWIKAIREIHMKAGVEVLVAGNVNMSEEIKREFNAFAIYTHNNWSGIYDYKQSWKRYAAVLLHNIKVWRQTKKLLKKTGPVDCIIVTSARIHHLLGWKRLCSERLNKDFKRVILFILTSEAIYDATFENFHFKKTALLMKRALMNFKREVQNGSVVLAGDSHITSKEYESLGKVPFRVFPSPGAGLQASLEMQTQSDRVPNEVPCFVTLGVSVIDKGVDVLQEAILILLKKDPQLKAKFVLQCSVPIIDYNGKLIPISEELRKANQVVLLEKTLDEEEYKNYLQQSDFVVLPYRRKVYFNRLSGVAVEAACAGIPMIVTENTWLAWAMNEYGAGVTSKDEDAADLADKIDFCIRNWQTLAAKGKARKETARFENSTERYLEAVWS